MSPDLVKQLEAWYAAQCNGDWEHSYGVRIDTLDNPGWTVSIDLASTPLARRSFPELRDVDPERDWVHCFVKDGRFEGRCGPNMLNRVLEVFLMWTAAAKEAP
jgi:hypothetical protein